MTLALAATEHSPPAYLHMVILGGIVAAALVLLGVNWWRRRQRDPQSRKEQ